jgi:hypothetical protein
MIKMPKTNRVREKISVGGRGIRAGFKFIGSLFGFVVCPRPKIVIKESSVVIDLQTGQSQPPLRSHPAMQAKQKRCPH